MNDSSSCRTSGSQFVAVIIAKSEAGLPETDINQDYENPQPLNANWKSIKALISSGISLFSPFFHRMLFDHISPRFIKVGKPEIGNLETRPKSYRYPYNTLCSNISTLQRLRKQPLFWGLFHRTCLYFVRIKKKEPLYPASSPTISKGS